MNENTFDVLFSVEQLITEGENKKNVQSTYTVTLHVDKAGDMVIIKNPTIASKPDKSTHQPKPLESDGTVDAVMTEEINSFLETFFKLYPTATEKELVNPIYIMGENQVKAVITVKYLDNETQVV